MTKAHRIFTQCMHVITNQNTPYSFSGVCHQHSSFFLIVEVRKYFDWAEKSKQILYIQMYWNFHPHLKTVVVLKVHASGLYTLLHINIFFHYCFSDAFQHCLELNANYICTRTIHYNDIFPRTFWNFTGLHSIWRWAVRVRMREPVYCQRQGIRNRCGICRLRSSSTTPVWRLTDCPGLQETACQYDMNWTHLTYQCKNLQILYLKYIYIKSQNGNSNLLCRLT